MTSDFVAFASASAKNSKPCVLLVDRQCAMSDKPSSSGYTVVPGVPTDSQLRIQQVSGSTVSGCTCSQRDRALPSSYRPVLAVVISMHTERCAGASLHARLRWTTNGARCVNGWQMRGNDRFCVAGQRSRGVREAAERGCR